MALSRATIQRCASRLKQLPEGGFGLGNTTEHLRAALDRALSRATFDLGRIDTSRPEGWLSSYANRPDETLDAQSFREMHVRTRGECESWGHARTPMVRLDDECRNALEGTIRNLFGDFVDPSDRICHTFPMGGDGGRTVTAQVDELYTDVLISSVEQFADSLVRGAAVAGSERVAGLVAGWVEGTPVSYRTCIVVPIAIARAVSPVPGVDVVPLALSTADLPAGLPVGQGRSRADYLGQTLVSVDTEATPALFRLEKQRPERQAARAALKPQVSLETIREALSLEADAFVDRGLIWDDFGDFSALANHAVLGRGKLGYLRERKGQTTSMDTWVSTIEVSDDIRDLSEERIGETLRKLKNADVRTRVAVSRWKMAKDGMRGSQDRLIDLRIALESLFLAAQPDQELKYRLSVSGAWFVGEDAADRRRIWDTLRAAYDLSSAAVHGGDLKKRSKRGKDPSKVLADGLTVCRKGILRVLDEGPITDWTELVLNCRDA